MHAARIPPPQTLPCKSRGTHRPRGREVHSPRAPPKASASSSPAPCLPERARAERPSHVLRPAQTLEPEPGCRPARQLASRDYLSFCIKRNRGDCCSLTFNAIAAPFVDPAAASPPDILGLAP